MTVKTDITIDSSLILGAISLIMTTLLQLLQAISKIRGETPIETWDELLAQNEELRELIATALVPVEEEEEVKPNG